MLILNVRDHDGERRRVWSEEQHAYGQFDVVSSQDLDEFKALADKMTIDVRFRPHRCDGSDECKCRYLSYGELIKDHL